MDDGFATPIAPADGRPSASAAAVDADCFLFAGFVFDCRRDELGRDATTIPVRPKPRALLRYMLANPGRLLEKGELTKALWGRVIVSDDSLVQCVRELRAALQDHGRLIRTLPRRGYMFDTAVVRVPAEQQSAAEPAPAATTEAQPQNPPPEPMPAAAPVRPRAAVRWVPALRWGAPLVAAALLGVAGAFWKIRQPAALRIDDEILARHAVAVLPLAEIDGPSGGPAVGSALANEISAQIAVRQNMRVVGPASTAHYDAAVPEVSRIARDLGVRYVISGFVAQDGGGVVVDAKLSSVQSGSVTQLARFTFPSAAEALHSNFDQSVASAFRMQYYEIDNARATEPGHTMDAADLTLTAWRDLNRFSSRDDLLRARARFEAALRIDPDSVVALQGLGSTYQIEIFNLFSRAPRSLVEPGMRALERAVALSPDRPENLLPWGSMLGLSGHPAEAKAVYLKALELNPKYAFAHIFVARALIAEGRFVEAQREIEKAQGLSPSDARILNAVYSATVAVDFAQGRDDDAYRWSLRWAAEYPTNGEAHAYLAAIDALHGRDLDAATHMARHRALLPNNTLEYVEFLNPSADPGYLAQRRRFLHGLRMAGLPPTLPAVAKK